MAFAPNIDLKEAWRWQGGTRNDDIPGRHGGAVDEDGNVYMAGWVGMPWRDDEYTAADFGVYKLNGDTGEIMWEWSDRSDANTFNAVNAVTVDLDGNVIVGGFTRGGWAGSSLNSDENNDYAAAKLNGETGAEIWRYQNTFISESTTSGSVIHSYGVIWGVSTDSAGDVFFVGYVYGTWVQNAGHLGDHDYVIGKLDGSSGQEKWQIQGGPGDSEDYLYSCATDSEDNLVVAGYTQSAISGSSSALDTSTDDPDTEHLVMKFNNDGDKLWSWQNGTDLDDKLYDVTVDGGDNIYVVGAAEITESTEEYVATSRFGVVKKFTSSGVEVWEHIAETSQNASADGYPYDTVAVDDVTGMVVAGASVVDVWGDNGENAGEIDFAATALDGASGAELGRWQDGTIENDLVWFVKFDSEGSLFVGGSTYGTYSEGDDVGGFDLTVTKFQRGGGGVDDSTILLASFAGVGALTLVCIIASFSACFLVRKKARSNGEAGSVHKTGTIIVAPPAASSYACSSTAGSSIPANPQQLSKHQLPRYSSAIRGFSGVLPQHHRYQQAGRDGFGAISEHVNGQDRDGRNSGTDDNEQIPEGSPPKYESMKNLFGKK